MFTTFILALSLLAIGALVFPNGGEVIALEAICGKTNATAWTLRLYSAISPALSKDTVVGHLTEETGGGYAAIALTAANWTATGGSPSTCAYAEQTFTFTGAAPTVLGYYITRADGALVYAEPLTAPFTPANNGDTVKITPQFTLGSVTSD